MSKKKQTKATDETQQLPVATAVVSKLPNGATQFNFMGPHSDVLGLLEVGKIYVQEQVRANILNGQAPKAEGT